MHVNSDSKEEVPENNFIIDFDGNTDVDHCVHVPQTHNVHRPLIIMDFNSLYPNITIPPPKFHFSTSDLFDATGKKIYEGETWTRSL